VRAVTISVFPALAVVVSVIAVAGVVTSYVSSIAWAAIADEAIDDCPAAISKEPAVAKEATASVSVVGMSVVPVVVVMVVVSQGAGGSRTEQARNRYDSGNTIPEHFDLQSM
jgi:hypothetical protein